LVDFKQNFAMLPLERLQFGYIGRFVRTASVSARLLRRLIRALTLAVLTNRANPSIDSITAQVKISRREFATKKRFDKFQFEIYRNAFSRCRASAASRDAHPSF